MKSAYFLLALASLATPMKAPKVEAQPLSPTQNKTQTVTIGGEVRRPGTYRVPSDSSLLSLFALAGGATDEAILEKVTLTRGGIITPLDLLDAFKASNQARFVFQNGDLLSVPRRQLRVSIVGAVKNPGSYVIPEAGISVADALALAGGASDIKGKVEVLRLTRSQVPTPRDAPPLQSAVTLQTVLRGNDVIVVRELKTTREVTIYGQVRKPGIYEVPAGQNLASLLALAGGVAPEAALSEITVRRGDAKFIVNLLTALQDPTGKANFVLESGDLVTVPRNENRVSVLGAVRNPGSYAIPEGRTLSAAEALELAGGITGKGNLEVRLIKRPEKIKADDPDLPAVIRTVKPDYILQSGDAIYVSEVKKPSNPNPYLRLLNSNLAQ